MSRLSARAFAEAFDRSAAAIENREQLVSEFRSLGGQMDELSVAFRVDVAQRRAKLAEIQAKWRATLADLASRSL